MFASHRFDPHTGLLTGTKDGNLVNIFLRIFGRCTERTLCIRLLIFQVKSKCIDAINYYKLLISFCFIVEVIMNKVVGICKSTPLWLWLSLVLGFVQMSVHKEYLQTKSQLKLCAMHNNIK